jgi:TnpA family transposase
VPVEFLTDEQASVYGRFTGPPSRADLERFFYLDDVDRALIAKRRGDHNRLGFGLQLVTVRFLGTFLAEPVDVPTAVLDFVAEQVEVADASVVKGYLERRTTRVTYETKRVSPCESLSRLLIRLPAQLRTIQHRRVYDLTMQLGREVARTPPAICASRRTR